MARPEGLPALFGRDFTWAPKLILVVIPAVFHVYAFIPFIELTQLSCGFISNGKNAPPFDSIVARDAAPNRNLSVRRPSALSELHRVCLEFVKDK
jgi:hypothetical protein